MDLVRRMVLLLATLLVAAPALAQDDPAVAFVRDFYVKEIARHAAKEHQSEDDFLKVFTADAQELWRAAQANRGKTNVKIGRIVHVFFGLGALPGREVKLVAVEPAGNGKVTVALTIQGNPKRLAVQT